ncbi:MAG TPA: hypothetical protein VGW78_02260 [Candidatus Babeliales bacterium]|nr:hypothetical protein [Candidatus Babeliales bacterium]
MKKHLFVLVCILYSTHSSPMNTNDNQNIGLLLPEHFDQTQKEKPSLHTQIKQLKAENALSEIRLSDLQKSKDSWKKTSIAGWSVSAILLLLLVKIIKDYRDEQQSTDPWK